MFEWLSDNWGTLLIAAILIAVVAAVVIHLIRKRLRGERSCACGCSGCSGKKGCPYCKSAEEKNNSKT